MNVTGSGWLCGKLSNHGRCCEFSRLCGKLNEAGSAAGLGFVAGFANIAGSTNMECGGTVVSVTKAGSM